MIFIDKYFIRAAKPPRNSGSTSTNSKISSSASFTFSFLIVSLVVSDTGNGGGGGSGGKICALLPTTIASKNRVLIIFFIEFNLMSYPHSYHQNIIELFRSGFPIFHEIFKIFFLSHHAIVLYTQQDFFEF